MSGLFIAFEGGDRSGKSTQQPRLVERLRADGREVVATRQPGGTDAGQLIRRIVLDTPDVRIDPRCEALLIAADKAQHVDEVIRPALARGAVVVTDRYVDSMLAYQGAGRTLAAGELAELAAWATGGLHPDLTVVLDVDPAEAVERVDAKDRMEGAGLAFHQRARQYFLDLAAADPTHYLVLDARDTRENIAAAVWARTQDLLP